MKLTVCSMCFFLYPHYFWHLLWISRDNFDDFGRTAHESYIKIKKERLLLWTNLYMLFWENTLGQFYFTFKIAHERAYTDCSNCFRVIDFITREKYLNKCVKINVASIKFIVKFELRKTWGGTLMLPFLNYSFNNKYIDFQLLWLMRKSTSLTEVSEALKKHIVHFTCKQR